MGDRLSYKQGCSRNFKNKLLINLGFNLVYIFISLFLGIMFLVLVRGKEFLVHCEFNCS